MAKSSPNCQITGVGQLEKLIAPIDINRLFGIIGSVLRFLLIATITSVFTLKKTVVLKHSVPMTQADH